MFKVEEVLRNVLWYGAKPLGVHKLNINPEVFTKKLLFFRNNFQLTDGTVNFLVIDVTVKNRSAKLLAIPLSIVWKILLNFPLEPRLE